MIAERNPNVRNAVVKLRRLSADEQTRYAYEMREKARRDMESQERWARLEGRQEEKLEIAKNLLNLDVSIDKIAKSTGLSQAEVERLMQ
jgi:predicted transposase/invertase (TIGR01784 family)